MHLLEICSADGTTLKTLRLDPTRAYAVGRSPRCDVCLPVGSVSRRHAAIFCHAGVWRIVDTGSRRGLLVSSAALKSSRAAGHGHLNGGPTDAGHESGLDIVRQVCLRPDDLVGVGPAWLRLGLPSQRSGNGTKPHHPAAPSRASSVDINARTLELPSLSAGEFDPVADQRSGEVFVVEIAGHTLGVYDLRSVDHATLGTDPCCRIVLPARPGVTPLHAVLLREGKWWSIIDAGGGLQSGGARYLRRRFSPDVAVDLGTVRVRMMVVTSVAAKDDSKVEGSSVHSGTLPASGTFTAGISAFLSPSRDGDGHVRLVDDD